MLNKTGGLVCFRRDKCNVRRYLHVPSPAYGLRRRALRPWNESVAVTIGGDTIMLTFLSVAERGK